MEKTKRKCKVCGEEKEHIFVGRHASRASKFVDETGAYWNGRTCSTCQKAQVRRLMAEMRAKRKSQISE